MAGADGTFTGSEDLPLPSRLLQGATKKRSSHPSSLLEASPAPPAATARKDAAAARELIARSVAAALLQAGRTDIGEAELEQLMEQLLRETAQVWDIRN